MDFLASRDESRDMESRTGTVIGIAVSFAVVSTVVMGLRLYTRFVLSKVAGWDDWTMLAAQILSVTVSVLKCAEVRYGLGRHAWVVSDTDSLQQLKYLYADIILYNLGMNIVKMSFLIQYRRIFSGSVIQTVCLWSMYFVGLWAVVQEILQGMTCVPVSAIIPHASKWCLDTLPVWYISSAVNIISDFCIFLIPLPTIWQLQLPRRRRYLITGVFCLGFFVCIISIIRITFLREAAFSDDPTWDNTDAAIWSIVELNCAILCSSLPVIRPVLAQFIPAISSSPHHTSRVYERYGSGETGPSTGRRRTDHAKTSIRKTTSEEELALSAMDAQRQETVLYANCSADGRSDDSLELSLDHSKKDSTHIKVVTKTSTQVVNRNR